MPRQSLLLEAVTRAPAGGTYSGFGFNGTWNGITNSIPTAFSLNGTACIVN
jgi:hypothetical protein